MYPYIAEFIGTTMLVFMGDSVSAANSLEGSLFKDSGAVFTVIGWGLSVALPAMCFNASSGAFFNPALTIGEACAGLFDWGMVPGYVIVQMLGGFVGACVMWLYYKDQFEATDNPEIILNVFCTSPAIPNLPMNLLSEVLATMMFVTYLLNIPALAADWGMKFIYVDLVIMSIGYSLRGTTDFAMNPASDLSPRIAHAVLPIQNKGDSNWRYAFVPVIGPLIGGIIGAIFGNWISNFPVI